jgi:hypothetical protein
MWYNKASNIKDFAASLHKRGQQEILRQSRVLLCGGTLCIPGHEGL